MGIRLLLVRSGLIFTMTFFIAGCSKTVFMQPGYLKGVISIGPICPVETIPPNPDCLPTAETYKAYPVWVYTADGRIKITQLRPALDGSFISELSPGSYLVLLERAKNGIGGSNLPVEVTITSNNNTELDINIDTGIR